MSAETFRFSLDFGGGGPLNCLPLVTLVIAARIAARGIPVTCARKRMADAAWSKRVSSIAKERCDAGDGSQLGSECEDAADEIVKELAKEALGRTLSSCAELKDIVGACEREAAKMHCPASCGLCDGVQDRHDHAHRALKSDNSGCH